MIRVRRFAPVITILSAALLIGSSLFAANGNGPEKKPKIGKISAGPASVEWTPQIDSERLLLSVSTPWGEVWSKEFPAGKNPIFRIHDIPGRVVDGTYTWELRAAPRIHPQVKKQMEALREAGDDAGLLRLRAEHGLDVEQIESGGFTVLNGSIVSPDMVEQSSGFPGSPSAQSVGGTSGASASSGPVKAMDQVIPDDLIVQGSICVGFDCINNESFGFDTIRLKENNLRIKFEDTSAGSFPTTDWQLTANDSSSGGQNKFSIEDITAAQVPFTVEGGAATNSLYVDSTGRVGFRTANPVLDLHVNTTNTPGWRLEQNNAGGFTAQTWDIAGNEANFFIRDVTGGSRLPFRIRPGAPTSSIDIAASGFVGMGTSSPTSHLHIVGNVGGGPVRIAQQNSNAAGFVDHFMFNSQGQFNGFQLAGSGVAGLQFGLPQANMAKFISSANLFAIGTSVSSPLILGTSDQERIRVLADGKVGIGTAAPGHPLQMASGAHVTAGGVWTNASSRSLKTDVHALDSGEAIRTLASLEPVTFRYLSEEDEVYVGFIAEDVPDLVATGDRASLSPMDVVAVLTKVVQEQNRIIETLTERVNALETTKD